MPEPAPSTSPDSPRPAVAVRPTICLVLHAYQPTNIGEAEIEQTVRCVYQPVVLLHAALALPLTLNVQGCLLERLQTIAPGFLDMLRDLARCELIEFATSAHYHPCLPLLSRERRHRQIALNLRTVETILGVRPCGFWPPELAWSPVMGEELAAVGLGWTIIDGSAFVRAWSHDNASVGDPVALYHPAELTRTYSLASHAGLVAMPRQHEWSCRLFEGDTLLHGEQLAAILAEMRAHARGLICLATDAERLTAETLRLYERLLRKLAEFADFRAATKAIAGHPPREAIDLPVWSWRGALDLWVRGEGERSFLRELEDAYRRRAQLAVRLQDAALAAVDGQLMRAESSCWLFWRSPCRFLAEGFAQIGRANRIMEAA